MFVGKRHGYRNSSRIIWVGFVDVCDSYMYASIPLGEDVCD